MSDLSNNIESGKGASGRVSGFINLILPGFLIAATGVGAGDLATASFTGSHLGVAVLWAVVVGGVFKFILTEGLARWQLVTGKTFIEGVTSAAENSLFGQLLCWLFLCYLVFWSFFVGSALMSACGVALNALFPVFSNGLTGKVIFGVGCSLAGFLIVRIGGFALFEKVMGVCILVMFFIVIYTAFAVWPGTQLVLKGLFIPSIPLAEMKGLTWTLALIGGVGGTLTILCYGYWIKEKGRRGESYITMCRQDLLVGYTVTVFFGLAMVIIGSTITVEGKGANLLLQLAQTLCSSIGEVGSWLFLVGAFCAIFSSVLGVWQAVPYLFADIYHRLARNRTLSDDSEETHEVTDLSTTKAYHYYLVLIASVPAVGLFMSFKEVQKLYALVGVFFVPMLALALLIMNSRKGTFRRHANGPFSIIGLLAVLCFFGYMAWLKVSG